MKIFSVSDINTDFNALDDSVSPYCFLYLRYDDTYYTTK